MGRFWADSERQTMKLTQKLFVLFARFCYYLRFENLVYCQYLLQGENMSENSKAQPLNQILYGPPGTGKTYATIDKALEILGIDIANLAREERKAKFDEFRESGQIEFVTFHQSYSYEEFVEGIKPVFADKNGNKVEPSQNMVYKVRDGIFKDMSKLALYGVAFSEQDYENFCNT